MDRRVEPVDSLPKVQPSSRATSSKPHPFGSRFARQEAPSRPVAAPAVAAGGNTEGLAAPRGAALAVASTVGRSNCCGRRGSQAIDKGELGLASHETMSRDQRENRSRSPCGVR